jgi:hypothetical protein
MGSDEGGTLTPEVVYRGLDALWNPRSRRTILPAPQPADPTVCSAVLFAPDDSLIRAVKHELIAAGTPVHPFDLPYLGPAQGPRPAVCAREPHPDSPYHWDGRGTWWRCS